MARVFQPGPAPGDEPTANLEDVKAGIRWVIKQGAKVINLSIGAEEQGFNLCRVFANCQSPLRPIVEEAWAQGALPIIAAPRLRSSTSVSNVYEGPSRSISIRDTDQPGLPAAASSAIASRCSAPARAG